MKQSKKIRKLKEKFDIPSSRLVQDILAEIYRPTLQDIAIFLHPHSKI